MGNAYRSVLALKPTGDAVPANVLAGKTFSNADGVGKTGTMVNNGAVTITLTDQDPSYTVPQGYHNGSGIVSFTPSGGDGADLVVTCSADFAGATISCTDGTTTFTEICPSTSPYEVTFESIPTGTWTISGTVGGRTYSTIKTIIDFNALLEYIPEGSTITPTNDIQIWLHCANIWDKSYTTISEVLSDSTTLLALISDSNAVDYMVRSTTWASSVSVDSTAMTYIGNNEYCSENLLEDSTWLTAICNSAYFESVLKIKVPTMTSNTAPQGRAFGNGSYSGDYYMCFDQNSSSEWESSSSGSGNAGYIGYQFTTQPCINKIQITTATYSSWETCKLQASNSIDSNDWIDVQQIQNMAANTSYDIVINNTNNYSCYRLYGSAGNRVGCKSLQFYGRE